MGSDIPSPAEERSLLSVQFSARVSLRSVPPAENVPVAASRLY
jgi:hypothetical protein